MSEATSTAAPVRTSALGGLGEIGLNLMVVECAGRAIVIDCGLMFPDVPSPANTIVVPDFEFFQRSALKVDAVILTHAHEDHIGALPHLLRHVKAPVYATDVTLAFARRRLRESGFEVEADLRTLAPRRDFDAGPVRIEPLRVTHSTPDSVALALRTPAGIIVHSGDFKIDDAPVDGQRFDRERFAALGAEGVALLLSDSTNVERAGRSGSESSLKPIIRELMGRTHRQFFLSSFSSHLHRIRQVAEVAREFGRHVVPLGRRMAESVRLGIELGLLPFAPGTFIDDAEAEFLEPRRLAYLASGSQGEPLSALAKLAADAHPRVHVSAGDVVVLSSRFIPGNERTINTLVNRLYRLGAEVIYDAIMPGVHVSGHASRDELAEMLTLVRPRHFIPIHGEYRHLSRHGALAIETGVIERDCFILDDGDTFVLDGASAHRGSVVPAGRRTIESGEEADPELAGERRTLGRDGTVTAILVISAKTGQIIRGPDLVSRGLVSGNGTSIHMRRARDELAERLRRMGGPFRADEPRLRDEVVDTVRRYFSAELGKRPLVIPYVTEV